MRSERAGNEVNRNSDMTVVVCEVTPAIGRISEMTEVTGMDDVTETNKVTNMNQYTKIDEITEESI